MSLIIDDEGRELTANERLGIIINKLEIIILHLEKASDEEYTTEDIENGNN